MIEQKLKFTQNGNTSSNLKVNCKFVFQFSHAKQFHAVLFASVCQLYVSRLHIQAKGRPSAVHTTANTRLRTAVQQTQISVTARPKKIGHTTEIKRSTSMHFAHFKTYRLE